MKFELKIIVSLIIILISINKLKAQDPQYSQFYASPLYLSPSLAGATGTSRIAYNFRDQWPAFAGTFITSSVSFDTYFPQYRSGVGVLFMGDFSGSSYMSQYLAGLQYSFDIPLNTEFSIRPGLGAYYIGRGIMSSNFIFGDQLTTQLIGGGNGTSVQIPPIGSTHKADISASAVLFSRDLWFGFTADHLLMPNVSLAGLRDPLPMKFTAFAGVVLYNRITLRKEREQNLTLAANFKHQGNANQLDLGVYWRYRQLLVGSWYRGIPLFKKYAGSDAIVLTMGLQTGKFNIGYSYDITFSDLISETGGAHEVSLTFIFDIKPRKKLEAIPCPNF